MSDEEEVIALPVGGWDLANYSPPLESILEGGKSPWIAMKHHGHETRQEVRLYREDGTWRLKFRRPSPEVTTVFQGHDEDPLRLTPAMQLICATCGKPVRRRAAVIERLAVDAACTWEIRGGRPQLSLTARR